MVKCHYTVNTHLYKTDVLGSLVVAFIIYYFLLNACIQMIQFNVYLINHYDAVIKLLSRFAV